MARRTKVATNVYNTVKEATKETEKPVLFFPARFDIYQAQAGDGYAYDVALRALGKQPGKGGNGVSTSAQGEWWGSKALGTIPHALIASYEGDSVKATLKFAEKIDPEVKRIALVDYDNDCVNTTLATADAMLAEYIASGNDERYILFGVRLDTSATMVDKSVQGMLGQYKPTGVNEKLVWNVYNALQERAARFEEGSVENEFYKGIGIVVSGGFDPEKIRSFEKKKVPVAGYGVGSSMFNGNFDFTADIVSIMKDGEWIDNSKEGRRYNPNQRLEEVI
jgi:nicotinate phosphoribosyltransferase